MDIFRRKKARDSKLIQNQLAALLAKGRSVEESLLRLGQALEGEPRETVERLSDAYASTKSLGRALSGFPDYFESDLIALVDVAEKERADLAVIFRQYGKYHGALTKILSVARIHLANRAFYLMAVVSVFLVILAIYSIFVLPQFESMYASFGAPVPGIAGHVLDLAGTGMVSLIGVVVLISIAVIVFLAMLKRFLGTLEPWQKSARHVPLLGGFLRDLVALRCLCYLDLLGDGGVSLPKSMGVIADRVGLDKRGPVADEAQAVLGEAKLFCPDTLTLLKVSAQAETLDSELKYQIEMEITRLLDKAASIGNPAMFALLIVLAAIIGAVVYGMYLPIFKIGTII